MATADTTVIAWTRKVSEHSASSEEFTTLFAESATLAYRVAYAVLRRPEEAQDVAQDAFLRAHRAFRELRDRERFRGWLVRTVFRLALDRQRGERRRQRREESVARREVVPFPSPEEELDRARLRERVAEAVEALPPKLRIVTLLAAMEGHEVRDVARLLDLPEGTVKSRLHRARSILAEELRCLVHDTDGR